MAKKANLSEIEKKEAIEISENIPSVNEFDLSTLKSDIESHAKEVKDQELESLIEKADIQKSQEIEKVEVEKILDFKENFQRILNFIFRFLNKPLKKNDITPFDKEFVSDFTDKLLAILPKDMLSKMKASMTITGKTKEGINFVSIFDFITFLTEALFDRIDEYKEIQKAKKVEGA